MAEIDFKWKADMKKPSKLDWPLEGLDMSIDTKEKINTLPSGNYKALQLELLFSKKTKSSGCGAWFD